MSIQPNFFYTYLYRPVLKPGVNIIFASYLSTHPSPISVNSFSDHLLPLKQQLTMSNPAFQFVSPEIMSKLASLKPYILVVLTKGENYGLSDTPRIIQSEHLPYVFQQRSDNQMVLTMPVKDN